MAKLSRKKVLWINTSPGGRFQAVGSWSQNDCFAWKGALWTFGVVTPPPEEDDRLADD
jgi:hypothetical protein